MSITVYKNILIKELFVRTADENYITARWCAMNQVNTDFLWLAVHAIEKYLKAVLLANGQPAKGYSHNIVRLYDEMQKISGELLPELLVKPEYLEIYLWRDRTPQDFMKHLLSNGNADNRYLIYGYVTESADMHMLDQMVFSIRRLICQLEERKFKESDAPTFTHREFLARYPEYFGGMGMPLDKLISAKDVSQKQRVALNLNMAFAPPDFDHEPLRKGSSAVYPAVDRYILRPLKSDDPEWAAEGVEVARWLLDNVQLPKGKPNDPGVTEQIKTAVEAACSKHDLKYA